MNTTLKNVSVKMVFADRKAITAAASAAEANARALMANAEAIKAIAEMGKNQTSPAYGLYFESPKT